MAETKIERPKEEIQQQKDREDRARRQINQKLKQKVDDFDHLHRDYKILDTEHKKKQEKMAELRQEIDRAATSLSDERVESTKVLEEAERDRMELHKQNHEEKETVTMVLQRLQNTYQSQLSHYKEQEADTVKIIKQLKDEWKPAENKSKMGLEQIQCILRAWQNKTKRLIDESSVHWWAKWAKNTAKL